MVITVKGTKTACAKGVRRIKDESADKLTRAAVMNSIRIDFFRPQITHVLKANITDRVVSAVVI